MEIKRVVCVKMQGLMAYYSDTEWRRLGGRRMEFSLPLQSFIDCLREHLPAQYAPYVAAGEDLILPDNAPGTNHRPRGARNAPQLWCSPLEQLERALDETPKNASYGRSTVFVGSLQLTPELLAPPGGQDSPVASHGRSARRGNEQAARAWAVVRGGVLCGGASSSHTDVEGPCANRVCRGSASDAQRIAPRLQCAPARRASTLGCLCEDQFVGRAATSAFGQKQTPANQRSLTFYQLQGFQ